VNVYFYDSLERSQKRIHQSSTAADIVKKVNFFFKFYILHDDKYQDLRQTDANLLCRVQYQDCPEQKNGFDCGIFAVAIVLHLAEQIDLKRDTFSQVDVTKARSQLAKALGSKSAFMTSDVFRNCFPCLCGRNIIESTGVEVITHVPRYSP
jgi:Ulp1 family protease